jgi:hypothetical protein
MNEKKKFISGHRAIMIQSGYQSCRPSIQHFDKIVSGITQLDTVGSSKHLSIRNFFKLRSPEKVLS